VLSRRMGVESIERDARFEANAKRRRQGPCLNNVTVSRHVSRNNI